jgi:hypothetical protein
MFPSSMVRQVVLPAIIAAGLLATATTATAAFAEGAEDPAPTVVAIPAAPAAASTPDPSEPAAAAVTEPPAEPTAAPPAPTLHERMLDFTMKSEDTLDMRGVEPSLYRGAYYRASVEPKRQCVAKRESEGFYDVVSHDGYFGAYQMSPALAKGATWMMLKEHKTLLGEDVAKRVLAKLRRTPVNEWPRYWQDAAFSTVYNWKHTGSGAKHWRGGRWHC